MAAEMIRVISWEYPDSHVHIIVDGSLCVQPRKTLIAIDNEKIVAIVCANYWKTYEFLLVFDKTCVFRITKITIQYNQSVCQSRFIKDFKSVSIIRLACEAFQPPWFFAVRRRWRGSWRHRRFNTFHGLGASLSYDLFSSGESDRQRRGVIHTRVPYQLHRNLGDTSQRLYSRDRRPWQFSDDDDKACLVIIATRRAN